MTDYLNPDKLYPDDICRRIDTPPGFDSVRDVNYTHETGATKPAMLCGQALNFAQVLGGVTKIYSYKDAVAQVDFESRSFMAQDVGYLVPDRKVAEIIMLESKIPGRGDASELLKRITEDCQECLIVLKAQPTVNPDAVGNIDYKGRLRDLTVFYERRGFSDINDIVNYENGVALCYRNKAYTKLRAAWNRAEALFKGEMGDADVKNMEEDE